MIRIAEMLARTLAERHAPAREDYDEQVLHAGWNPALDQLRDLGAAEPGTPLATDTPPRRP